MFRIAPTSLGLLAVDGVGDPGSTRIVYLTVVALLLLGLVFLVLGMWLFRRTRPDPELLLPLEQMDSRSWRRRDPATQLRLLDEARPAGATPLRTAVLEPSVDSEFAALRPVTSFDDLIGDRVAGESEGDSDEPQADIQDGSEDEDIVDDLATEVTESVEHRVLVDVMDRAQPTIDDPQVDDPNSDEPDVAAESVVSELSDQHHEPPTRDETAEIGRPSAVAHEALMLVLGPHAEGADLERAAEPPTEVVDTRNGGATPIATTSEFTVAFADRRPLRRRGVD
jgi:hypothetical protein